MSLRHGFYIFALGVAWSVPAFAADPAPPAAAVSQSAPTASAAPAPETAKPAVETITYLAPTWSDMLRAAVRFNALDLHDDNLIDEYAAVNYCDIYKFYFKDDFKWQEVRRRIRESAEMNSPHYPTHFYAQAVLALDRYNFDRKMFDFTPDTAIQKVNVFDLLTDNNPWVCTEKTHPRYIPRKFQAISTASFTLLGIPLAPADAQSLLRMMNADKNIDRQVIVRFDMTVTYIARLIKEAISPGMIAKDLRYEQAGMNVPGVMRMDVHVDSVEIFEDQKMTKLIYSTKPPP